MPLKTQRRRERVGGGGVGGGEAEDGWGVEGIKKIFYICCHALWNILLGTNGECKAVQSKDGITKAKETPCCKMFFSFFFFLSDSTADLPPYNGLFLNTVISVSDAVNTHLLKVGGLGFWGAEVWPYLGLWPPVGEWSVGEKAQQAGEAPCATGDRLASGSSTTRSSLWRAAQ